MSRAPRPGEVAEVERREDRRLHSTWRAGSRRRHRASTPRTCYNFLDILVDKKAKALAVNWDDEIVKATALTKDGAVVHPGFQPKSAA